MASLGHVAVGMALGRAHARDANWPTRARRMVAFAAAALAPDLDVIAFKLHVPYEAEWGHRGAAHSLALALLAGALIGLLARSPRTWLFATVALVSHGLLDTLTDGGLGVALLWPFTNARFFAPWQPIPVAPIGAGFLSARGLHCALVELALFAPCWLYALWPRRAHLDFAGSAWDGWRMSAPGPASRVEAIGRVLFKIRSWSPLPVIAAALALILFVPSPQPTPAIAWTLGALGVLACALGQALRAWVLGLVRAGTSGQNDYLEAVALNTAGPYAHVRNPLYVGNFLICLGLAIFAGHLWAALLGLGFFALEYAFIVPAEEGFLREKFGAAFDEFCRNVPRWRWRLSPAPSSQRLPASFDWRRALKKEHNPFCAWMSGLLAVLAARAWIHDGSGSIHLLEQLAAIEVALLVAYFAVKGWKHQWWTSPKPQA